MEEEFNDMIVLLLRYGREFCRTVGPSIFKNEECLYQLLGENAGDCEKVVVGGAGYKGLLALRAALGMVKRYAGMVRNGWVNLLECLFLLRSRQALPDALSEMEVRVCEERSDELKRRVYLILAYMVDTSVR